MARILAISSQTVFGPVGNSATVPALQEHGHEVLALPTILLSNHPGLGRPVGRPTDAQLMRDMLSRLVDMDELQSCDAVSTGYFAIAEQVVIAAEAIAALLDKKPNTIVQVDPVIGDNTSLYVPEPVAIAIRDRLVPLASVSTPNRFELGWLTSRDSQSDEAYLETARQLGVQELIVTSARIDDRGITTLHISNGMVASHTMPHQHNIPNGTGDFLAGQYLAHRLLMHPKEAFASAMQRVQESVSASVGKAALVLGAH